jgi:hypothetical protein
MKSLKLQIPEPCHENWNNMTPEEHGRFCMSCSKTVIDFTAMTDRQVLEYFKNYTGSTCGRFSNDQLDRTIAEQQQQRSWWKYALNILVPAMLVSAKGAAQGSVKVVKPETVCAPQVKKTMTLGFVARTVDSKKSDPLISGTVKDENGAPVQGANIRVLGAAWATVSGPAGEFTLRNLSQVPVTIEVSCIGYITRLVEVNSWNEPRNPIILKQSITGRVKLAGEVIVIVEEPVKQTVFHNFKRFVADSLGMRSFKVYPNPARAGAPLSANILLGKGSYIIQIADMSGKMMQEDIVQVEPGQMNIVLNLQRNLLPGHYAMAILNNKRKKIGTQQLIVQ